MGRSDAAREEQRMKRFEVGSRVVEPTYGLDEHGVKKFLTSMSKLEPSSEPVPAGMRAGKVRKKRAPKKVAEPVAAVEEE